MLGRSNAVANLAVRDLDRARAFYTETLGLEQVDNEGEELVVLRRRGATVEREVIAPCRFVPLIGEEGF